MKVLLLLGVALSGLTIAASVPDKVVCYYGGWAVYRPGNGKFDVENIDPFVCTHLIYSFVGLAESGEIVVLDPWIDLEDNWGRGAYKRFNNLKKVNPNLKTLIAIGGWNEGSMKYSKTFRDPSKIATFVRSAVDFVRTHGFDGLDLDWEYPNQRGGEPMDVDSFSALIRALRTEFDKYGYLLTAAVAAAEKSFSLSYDVPQLGQYLHFINIMTYDYHGAWENITGHNAPIYVSAVEQGTDIEGYNADVSIQKWIEYGAPPEKLVLGVGLYGRSFTLKSTSCNGPRCPVSGAGLAGQFTREAGMLGYNEICVTETGDASALKFWDEEAQVPYMTWGNQWVGYDNELSAKLKVDYVKKYNLGGAMVWSIDTDDFNGACGKGRYPLLNVLKNEIGISSSAPTTAAPTTAAPTTAAPTTAAPTTAAPTTAAPTTAAPTTAAPTTAAPTTAAPTTSAPTTAAPTTAAPTTDAPAIPETQQCKFAGYNRDPTNCRVFYQCYVVNGAYKSSTFTCKEGLAFDLTRNICNYESEVEC